MEDSNYKTQTPSRQSKLKEDATAKDDCVVGFLPVSRCTGERGYNRYLISFVSFFGHSTFDFASRKFLIIHVVTEEERIPAQWFVQYLDHFNAGTVLFDRG